MGKIRWPAEMGNGARAGPHPLRPSQPLLQISTSERDGVIDRVILRHHGGDGTGITATGTVAVAGVDTRRS